MSLPEPLAYPKEPHTRRHAPTGYKNYQDYKPWLRDECEFRCVYCLQRETWSREGSAIFSVDHVVAQSETRSLVCVYGNLVYACVRCNSFRQDTRTLDPAKEGMGQHLRVEPDGSITALTEDGELLIELFHLDADPARRERKRILRILERRKTYPDDEGVRGDFQTAFGYPEDLPDLRTLKPPGGNPLEGNRENCFHARRERGQLPETY